MDYLQRLIQRSSMTTPHHMLLPRSNQWSDAADPFEHTRFIPPMFPDTARSCTTEGLGDDSGEHLSKPAAKIQTSRDNRQEVIPPPMSENNRNQVNLLSASDLANTSAAHSVEQRTAIHLRDSKVWSGRSSPEPENDTIASLKASSQRPVLVEQTKQRPVSVEPKSTIAAQTPWGRRYVWDLNLPDNLDKSLPAMEDDPSGKALGVSPRLALPQADIRHRLLFKPSSPSAKRRREADRAPAAAPRLVIGQLSVDVVPLKKKKPVKRRRRAATVKNRSYRHYSKLTQAETATIGFGIGQM